ncbi:hypothetical protein RRG08_012304 [Elysia crispata]|uniref:Uncharacterized protein n=1 Tax=Elysia crispata TaxID=231223 RepID=A0AAE1BAZ6_9GAST|nr:hypothetical protein RRG08_012304 [Elysia crispata]
MDVVVELGSPGLMKTLTTSSDVLEPTACATQTRHSTKQLLLSCRAPPEQRARKTSPKLFTWTVSLTLKQSTRRLPIAANQLPSVVENTVEAALLGPD